MKAIYVGLCRNCISSWSLFIFLLSVGKSDLNLDFNRNLNFSQTFDPKTFLKINIVSTNAYRAWQCNKCLDNALLLSSTAGFLSKGSTFYMTFLRNVNVFRVTSSRLSVLSHSPLSLLNVIYKCNKRIYLFISPSR